MTTANSIEKCATSFVSGQLSFDLFLWGKLCFDGSMVLAWSALLLYMHMEMNSAVPILDCSRKLRLVMIYG